MAAARKRVGDARRSSKGIGGLLVLLCVAALAAGVMAATAVARGNQTAGGGQTTGLHGQDCPPGYHDAGNSLCEHNGGGGGNCGDNQSGNNNGQGNDGNDNGFGHRPGCDPATTTGPTTATTVTTPTTSTTTTASTSTTPGTTTTTHTQTTMTSDTTTTSSTSTTPTTSTPLTTTTSSTETFTPPVLCAKILAKNRATFLVGQRSALLVTVRAGDGHPMADMMVVVRGAGVHLSDATNRSGVARFLIRAHRIGAIRISVSQPLSCTALSGRARALGVFKPPKPNFTGR